MSEQLFYLCLAGIAAITYAAVRISEEIADVYLVKHGKLRVENCQGDCGVYDLYEFMNWLDEKGAVREGFGTDHLIQDYVKHV